MLDLGGVMNVYFWEKLKKNMRSIDYREGGKLTKIIKEAIHVKRLSVENEWTKIIIKHRVYAEPS